MIFPKVVAKEPPICKAAPSLPLEPPNRCVITVAKKIAGANNMAHDLVDGQIE